MNEPTPLQRAVMLGHTILAKHMTPCEIMDPPVGSPAAEGLGWVECSWFEEHPQSTVEMATEEAFKALATKMKRERWYRMVDMTKLPKQEATEMLSLVDPEGYSLRVRIDGVIGGRRRFVADVMGAPLVDAKKAAERIKYAIQRLGSKFDTADALAIIQGRE